MNDQVPVEDLSASLSPQTEEPKAMDVETIAKALREPDETKAKKDARAAVKAMTGTWEHLPVRIRSAIRTDVGRFLAANKGRDDIIEAGYSSVTADRALRDLGRQ